MIWYCEVASGVTVHAGTVIVVAVLDVICRRCPLPVPAVIWTSQPDMPTAAWVSTYVTVAVLNSLVVSVSVVLVPEVAVPVMTVGDEARMFSRMSEPDPMRHEMSRFPAKPLSGNSTSESLKDHDALWLLFESS